MDENYKLQTQSLAKEMKGDWVELGDVPYTSSTMDSTSAESEQEPFIEQRSHIEKPKQDVDRTSNAYLMSCFFCFLMTAAQALSMVAAQLLDGVVPKFQLNMGGFGFALASVIPYVMYSKPSLRVPLKTIPLLGLLSLTLYLQNITFFAATLYIPVGTNHSLNKFTSITVTLVIAHVKWRMQGVVKLVDLLLDISAALVMMLGILLVVQPQFIFHQVNPLEVNISSYCNPERLHKNTSQCTLVLQDNFTSSVEMYTERDMDGATPDTVQECPDNSRPAWIGYIIGVSSGLLAVSKVFLVPAILTHTGVAQIMFIVPSVVFVLSTITAVSVEDFGPVHGPMCILLLIFNFIGAAGAHVGFFAVMMHMPTTDYTIVSCLALVMLMLFQFTVLTAYVPTRTDPIAIFGAVIISAIALGKPIIHRWVSSRQTDNAKSGSGACIPCYKSNRVL